MKRFLKGFVYAAQGIKVAILEERNMRFHLCAAFYVYLFSFFYDFSKVEYCVITILVAGVISLELVNTAFERTVSNPPEDRYVIAGTVKDIAAGAVLFFSLGAAICGIFLFFDIDIFHKIFLFFWNSPFFFVMLVCSFVLSYWFVFAFRSLFKGKDIE